MSLSLPFADVTRAGAEPGVAQRPTDARNADGLNRSQSSTSYFADGWFLEKMWPRGFVGLTMVDDSTEALLLISLEIEEMRKMKVFTLIIWLCLSATPVFADPGGIPNGGVGNGNGNGNENHMGAPAPLLGLGIPSGLAVGAVLLGAKLLERRRR